MADEVGGSNILNMVRREVTGAFGDAAKASIAMGGELLNANQKLSDYSKALTGNSKLFNGLGAVVNGLVQFAESSLNEYQTLTGIGASFGKEMSQIKISAAELGMNVEDMSKMFIENSAAMRTFGGTTDQAINRFRTLSKSMLDSDLGTQLRRLGMTAGEINETMIAYNEIAAQDGNMQRMSAQEQIQRAKDFAVELDGLAKLTGKQREELADQMRKERRQGDVQAFLMGQSADTQEAFMRGLTEINNTMGPQFGELFKDLMIRGAPITEETRNAFVALGGSADEFESTVAAFKQGMNTGSFDEFDSALQGAQGQFVDYLKTDEARSTAMLGGMSGISEAMGRAYESSYDFANALDAARVNNEDSTAVLANIQTQIGQEQLTQMEQSGNLLDKTVQLQEGLRDLTIAATAVLPRLEDAAIRGIDMFIEKMPSSEELARSMTEGIDSLFNSVNESMYNTDNNVISDLMGNISDPMGIGVEDGLGAHDAATGEDIAGLGETTTAAGEETQARVTETEEALNTAIAESDARRQEAEAALDEANAQLQNAIDTGVIPEIVSAQEAVNAAEEALANEIRESEARIRQAQADAYTAQQISRYQANPSNFRGGFAAGGNIPGGMFGLVGEAGPEFISGPAQIMSAKDSMNTIQSMMSELTSLSDAVQTQTATTQNQISNNASMQNNENMDRKFDQMIGLLGQLVQVETGAADTMIRNYRATRGLSGNILKGVS